jgi:F-type H+-transporting ATPase subunit beta
LLEGQGDDYPDQAFYMVGNFEDALQKGRQLAADAAKK